MPIVSSHLEGFYSVAIACRCLPFWHEIGNFLHSTGHLLQCYNQTRFSSSLSQISEIVPPASVSGADAKIPQKNRQMSNVWMFFATAQGMMKMT